MFIVKYIQNLYILKKYKKLKKIKIYILFSNFI